MLSFRWKRVSYEKLEKLSGPKRNAQLSEPDAKLINILFQETRKL